MDSYTSFAYVYDTFMDQEPYEEWADRVCLFLEKYGLPRVQDPGTSKEEGAGNAGPAKGTSSVNGFGAASDDDMSSAFRKEAVSGPDCVFMDEERNIVVDLGCGTGKFTEILAARGYDMIGIDLSEDMLAIAHKRKTSNESNTLYTCQDMRDFELYGAAGAMVSVGDSINYLLEEADLEAMFRCAARSLLPGGVFVFDFKTVHLYRDVIGNRTIAEDRGDCAFIWDNYYDRETCINEYDLAVFVQAEPEGQMLFRRFDEVHHQRGYEPQQLRRAAEQAGLLWTAVQDAETGGPVTKQTERAMAAVRKPFRQTADQ